jgi:signal transduction histidine kinase
MSSRAIRPEIPAETTDWDNTHLQAALIHDLRGALHTVAMAAEIVRDPDSGSLNAKQSRFLAIGEQEIQRALRMLADLSLLADLRMPETGFLPIDPERIDLRDAVTAAITAAIPVSVQREIQLELHPGPKAILNGDQDRLVEAITNLIENSFKYTADGGRVTVTHGVRGRTAWVSVADTGVGIKHEEIDRIFERGFRTSDAARSATPGSGLGLAIVKTIVEAHAGAVSVSSWENLGTVVTIELPLWSEVPGPSHSSRRIEPSRSRLAP